MVWVAGNYYLGLSPLVGTYPNQYHSPVGYLDCADPGSAFHGFIYRRSASGDNILPLPGVPLDPTAPALMFLSAVPWVLAGGILGPIPALLMGVFSGLMTALWETHNAFTPLIIGGLALLYSVTIRQRYRTQFYSFLRHPLGASLVLSLAYTPVLLFTAFFAINGSLAVRLDYALTQSWLMMLARGGELIIAGLCWQKYFTLEAGNPGVGEHRFSLRRPSQACRYVSFT